MKQLLAFHNKNRIKESYLTRVRAHESADEIIKGTYWEHGKGCAVGCTIEGNDHSRYEKELGLPEWLAHLEDVIFEGLTNGEAKTFPARFLEAIPVGADLSLVKPKFLYWLLEPGDIIAIKVERHRHWHRIALHTLYWQLAKRDLELSRRKKK